MAREQEHYINPIAAIQPLSDVANHFDWSWITDTTEGESFRHYLHPSMSLNISPDGWFAVHEFNGQKRITRAGSDESTLVQYLEHLNCLEVRRSRRKRSN